MSVTLKLDRAMDLMRSGSVLLETHTREGRRHVVEPGGFVSNEAANRIKNHPLVRAQCDGFWPGLDQTWRMIS
jgi:hypothetical protein